jgi:CheY-like chemotaxis protein
MKPSEVLLVEDNAGDALLIAQILADSAIPVKLHHARDGIEALLMLANSVLKPDLVILDLNVPNLSGCAVLERYHPKDVPVVVFSSSWNEADRTRSLELGAQEFVRKPMHLEAFKDAVCGMVEKWAVHKG